MQVGDNLRMNLNGDLGVNYAGGMNQGQSDHAMGFAGNGQLTGSYYSPNFLNFNVDPFYNRVQSDSVFGSLTEIDRQHAHGCSVAKRSRKCVQSFA